MNNCTRVALLYFVILVCLGLTSLNNYRMLEIATLVYDSSAYTQTIKVQSSHIAKLDGRIEDLAKQLVKELDLNHRLQLKLEFSSIMMQGLTLYQHQLEDVLKDNKIPLPVPETLPEVPLFGPQTIVPSGYDEGGNPINPLEVVPTLEP